MIKDEREKGKRRSKKDLESLSVVGRGHGVEVHDESARVVELPELEVGAVDEQGKVIGGSRRVDVRGRDERRSSLLDQGRWLREGLLDDLDGCLRVK